LERHHPVEVKDLYGGEHNGGATCGHPLLFTRRVVRPCSSVGRSSGGNEGATWLKKIVKNCLIVINIIGVLVTQKAKVVG
jgi:hypothetical protein